MTLKRQLLVIGALTLLIPLAGIQFVIQLEQALHAQELTRLNDQAERIAGALEQSTTIPREAEADRTLFAETFQRRLILDGYGDDWPNIPGKDGAPLLYSAGEHMFWRAALVEGNLWLFLEFRGLEPVFARDEVVAAQNGTVRDRLILSWRTPDGVLQEYLVEARAPGRATVRTSMPAKKTADRLVEGQWQTQPNGFSIELRLPMPPPGSLFGFSLEHPTAKGPAESIGTLGRFASNRFSSSNKELPLLVTDQPALNTALAPFVTPGQSLTLVTPAGWQLAHAEAPVAPPHTDISQFSPIELLQQTVLQGLKLLLSTSHKAGERLVAKGAQWRGEPLQRARQTTVSVALVTQMPGEAPALTAIVPVGSERPNSFLISRRSTDALLSLSSATLGQVLSRSLLLTLALLLVLVGYASWLSWRITRLRQSVSTVIDTEGRVTGLLTASPAPDELGDLSRHFARLVGQVRAHTQYLESFARKLSHELKTPLAVMRSSLDNLQHTEPSAAQLTYLNRATQGAERLSAILTAMSEATRLERSLVRTERETFDLAAVLGMASESYRDMDPRIRYRGLTGPCLMLGAPDLLVQALDKLIENAREFTPPTGGILIQFGLIEKHWILSVCNDGPLLPDGMAEHIFDSFVSVRKEGDGEGHLGQGLVIVKLVADFHHGRVLAENHPDGTGVCFHIHLPHPPTALPETR